MSLARQPGIDLGCCAQVCDDVVGKRHRVYGHHLCHAQLELLTVPFKVAALTTEAPVISVGVFGAP